MFIVKVREDHLLRHTLFENAATTSNTLCVVLQKKLSLKKKMSNNKRMRRKGAMQGSRRRKRSLSKPQFNTATEILSPQRPYFSYYFVLCSHLVPPFIFKVVHHQLLNMIEFHFQGLTRNIRRISLPF